MLHFILYILNFIHAMNTNGFINGLFCRYLTWLKLRLVEFARVIELV